MQTLSFSRAALGGFLYGAVMCAWIYYDRGAGFDELAIRFAVYFTAFTLGLWWLYNFIAKRSNSNDE